MDRLSLLRMTALRLALTALACGGGCRARTELVIVVASDLDVPAELTRIQIEGRNPLTGRTLFGTFDENVDPAYEASHSLPISLSITNRDFGEGDFVTYARAVDRDGIVVEQSIATSFLRDQTRALCLRLDRACRGVECAAGTTCVRGECVVHSIDVSRLATVTAASLGGVRCERATLEEGLP